MILSSHKKNVKKNRMKALYVAVIEARETSTNRRLCELFTVKPSKKDYPDYYNVILEPMDLKTIEYKIRNERYTTEEELVEDMKLMFRNARHYNEEGSQVCVCSQDKTLHFYLITSLLTHKQNNSPDTLMSVHVGV